MTSKGVIKNDVDTDPATEAMKRSKKDKACGDGADECAPAVLCRLDSAS
jgi:hypothetical protein